MRISAQTVLAVTAAALLQTQHAQHPHNAVVHFFFHLGVVGLLLVSIVDSSFVPLPIPGVTDIMLIVYAAAHENMFLLVAVATLGSALGGLISHAVGQAGGMGFLHKHVPPKLLARVTRWMEQHAILAVSLPAILPPPMPLSAFVLVAGAVKMSRKKFMWAFTVSRLVRHALAVWLGVHYGRDVLRLWAQFSAKWGMPIMIVLWVVILAATAWGMWKLYKTSKTMHLKPGALKGEAA
jgi:membrane protein YqaA with SNARE-associated domain